MQSKASDSGRSERHRLTALLYKADARMVNGTAQLVPLKICRFKLILGDLVLIVLGQFLFNCFLNYVWRRQSKQFFHFF
jgi:hypothetical protein